jgi:hypothetical protein
MEMEQTKGHDEQASTPGAMYTRFPRERLREKCQKALTIAEPKCLGAWSMKMMVSIWRCVGTNNLAGCS